MQFEFYLMSMISKIVSLYFSVHPKNCFPTTFPFGELMLLPGTFCCLLKTQSLHWHKESSREGVVFMYLIDF